MAGDVLQSIETGGGPLPANGSVLSDGTYEEERTPEPDDLKAWLSWGGKEEVAGRVAFSRNT
jgi:hypothetical protein